MGSPINKIDYQIGQQIGNCIYIGDAYSNQNWQRFAKFRCVCGKEFVANLQKVKRGHTKSCGCLLAGKNADRLTTHGMTETKEYNSWVNIIQRCTNVEHKRYQEWGGRGIKVCDRWLESFENFFEDMGKAPSSLHSIDRLNNDKDYYKENCAWHTTKQQANNRKSNIKITYNGETKTLMEWCEVLGLEYTRVRQRIKKLNWSVEKAFSKQ
jgi:hypothetical protein